MMKYCEGDIDMRLSSKNTIKLLVIVILIFGCIYIYYPRSIYSRINFSKLESTKNIEVNVIYKQGALNDGTEITVSSDKLPELIEIFKKYKTTHNFLNLKNANKKDIYIIKFNYEGKELGWIGISDDYVAINENGVGTREYIAIGSKIDLSILNELLK